MYNILSLVSCCELENKFYIMKEKTPVSVYIIIILCILGVLMMFFAIFTDLFGEMADFFAIGGIIIGTSICWKFSHFHSRGPVARQMRLGLLVLVIH